MVSDTDLKPFDNIPGCYQVTLEDGRSILVISDVNRKLTFSAEQSGLVESFDTMWGWCVQHASEIEASRVAKYSTCESALNAAINWIGKNPINSSMGTTCDQLPVDNGGMFRLLDDHSLSSQQRVAKTCDDVRRLISAMPTRGFGAERTPEWKAWRKNSVELLCLLMKRYPEDALKIEIRKILNTPMTLHNFASIVVDYSAGTVPIVYFRSLIKTTLIGPHATDPVIVDFWDRYSKRFEEAFGW